MKMKILRAYMAATTYITAAAIVTLAMWFGSSCDVLEIMGVNIIFTPFAPLLILAITEPEEKESKKKCRPCTFYTLSGGQFYGRKVG